MNQRGVLGRAGWGRHALDTVRGFLSWGRHDRPLLSGAVDGDRILILKGTPPRTLTLLAPDPAGREVALIDEGTRALTIPAPDLVGREVDWDAEVRAIVFPEGVVNDC